MITFQNIVKTDNFLTERSGLIPEHALFLDIETTGLSPQKNAIYCIGLACRAVLLPEQTGGKKRETEANADPGLRSTASGQGEDWMILQYFAETGDDESILLSSFLEFLKTYPWMLVTYNGGTFDLPFLAERCRRNQLTFDSSDYLHLDLYREAKSLKTLLSLPRLRQKDLEEYLGIARKDRMSGGRLIDVYLEYEKTQDPALQRLLWLHNFDDMKGMLRLLPILSFRNLQQGNFAIRELFTEKAEEPLSRLQDHQEYRERTENREPISVSPPCFGEENRKSEDKKPVSTAAGRTPDLFLCVRIEWDFEIPKPVVLIREHAKILLNRTSGILKLSVYQKTLKYFFSDYKNYYYLPREQIAIHKSVGQFVDRNCRKPATRETACVSKTGFFLPAFSSDAFPCFQENLRSGTCYWDLKDLTGSTDSPGSSGSSESPASQSGRADSPGASSEYETSGVHLTPERDAELKKLLTQLLL